MRRCIGSPCSIYLVLRSPRCVPCSIPGHLLRLMPASGFCVPVPVTSGRTGGGRLAAAGNLKILKNVIFFKTHFSHALSCALPAFCLSF
ncbi:unnamed protein product, partial [Staurois parvus]